MENDALKYPNATDEEIQEMKKQYKLLVRKLKLKRICK